jgi:hypothetical protein
MPLTYYSELIVFSKNTGPTIHAAVMACHTPIFSSSRYTSKICLRLILLQYLHFLAFVYPLR